MTDATKPFEDAALAAFGDVLVVGVNHQTAGSRLRDQLFVPEEEAPRRLAELREMGLDEALLLSTCDRVEMVTTARDPAATRQALLALLARWGELRAADLAGQSYCRTGAAAVRHLFAVTASLDSQVIGEPQVLGQVKESHRRAVDAGMMGPGLEPVLRAAYQAAKRVRAETALAERPVTLAAAALRVARDLHGKLGRCAGLLVGLGEMGELLASELQAAGLNDLAIAHPRASRAEAVGRATRSTTAAGSGTSCSNPYSGSNAAAANRRRGRAVSRPGSAAISQAARRPSSTA